MEHFKRIGVLALLAVSLPVVAQEEEVKAFFSLSSDRTFAPSDTPVVQLWGQGITKLQFRLYRVNDPVEFFRKLPDEHEFGAGTPYAAAKPTPLERLRQWKLGWRARGLSLVRSQFSMDVRVDYVQRYSDHPKPEPVRDRTPKNLQGYAAIPILNPQQLVTTWEQPFSVKNRWESSTVPIPTSGKGLYVVEATDGKLRAYTLVSVTDLGVIVKTSTGNLMVRAVRRDTGDPMSSVELLVLGKDKREKLGGGKTNADGYFELQVATEKAESISILARKDGDFAPIAAYGGNLSNEQDSRVTGYVYTDRPVYRPGHTVNYRAILRMKQTSGYALAKSGDYEVEAQDDEGKTFFHERRPLSQFGTLNGKFEIPASAGLGYYTVQVKSGQFVQAGNFRVEEYKKPEYEVRVTPDEKRVVQGKSIKAVIDAQYFYGEPVANAKVVYAVHKSRYWLPYYMDEMDEQGVQDEDEPYMRQEQTAELEGKTDASGKLTVSIPTAQDKFDMRYRVEARVTDVAGREIAGAGFSIATVAKYLIHVRSSKYVYSPTDQAQLEVETRDYDGNPVPNIAFTVDLKQWRWKQGEGVSVSQSTGVTDAQGKAKAEMPLASGSLIARVHSKTPEGREVQDTEYLWVQGGTDWFRSNEQNLTLVPDKKSYKPGETAKVLIVAGQAGANLWVTAQGRAVYWSKFVSTKDSTVMVDIPISRDFAPNFYVNAVMLRGNQLSEGSKLVKVPAVEQQIAVDLKPSKKEFKPGEPAVYDLEAKDYAGKPVQAEFSVGVVDEAIYSVRPETVRDILQFFYGREYDSVTTETSLHYYFHGEAGKRRMQLARIRPFNPRAQLKAERLVQPKVRRVFPDTAFWAPEVRTDSSGKASVKFEYPDSLTTWRATARGVTTDTKVGSAVNKVIVRKNLLTRLAVPRFFRQGDTVTVSVIAQNFLASEKKVRMSLDTKGLEIVQGSTQEVMVASRGTAVLDFQVKVPPGKEAVLTAKALSNEESDALELTIPVQPFGVKMSQPKGGTFSGNTSEAEAELTFPTDAEPGSRSMELNVSPSAAGAIFDALEYLTGFPYGCTEQTMSSFLPNIIVTEAVKTLQLKSRVDEALLKKQVNAGLERLYDYQHDDGGWGWWKTDESDSFMTAYVVAGLSQAKKAGIFVDEERIAKGAAWLKSGRGSSHHRIYAETQAYTAYALALAGLSEVPGIESLYGKRNEMDAEGLALTGLAMQLVGDNRAAEIRSILEASVKQNELEAWWASKRDPLLDIEFENSIEATAFVVKFLARQNPQSPLLPKAALYLVNRRTNGFYWNTTKQTAMVVYGLTDFVKQSGELQPKFAVTVYVNDQVALQKKYAEGDALVAATLRLPTERLQPGKNKVRVVRSGEGRVYWSARASYYSNSPNAGSGNQDLAVKREYFRMVPTNTGGTVVYNLEPFSGTAAQGDIIAVKLTLNGGEWRYLMVEDPIPSGAEILPRDDLYQFREKPAWWTYWFTNREYRDDRAVFFQTWFGRGAGTYFYLLKIVNPGTFRVSPARVEPMYQPQYFATSSPINLEVRK